jgi:hypothetical protein
VPYILDCHPSINTSFNNDVNVARALRIRVESGGMQDGDNGCVRKVLSDRSVRNGVEQAERSESRVGSI